MRSFNCLGLLLFAVGGSDGKMGGEFHRPGQRRAWEINETRRNASEKYSRGNVYKRRPIEGGRTAIVSGNITKQATTKHSVA